MSIPKQTLTIRDPGIGLAADAINAFVFVGCSEKGVVNALNAFSSIADVIDTHGQGPLSEDLAYYLDEAGGPVYSVRLAQNAAGAASAVVAAATGTGTITVAGAALDAYDVRVEIVVTGLDAFVGSPAAPAVDGQFRYSLDGGNTFSPNLVIPAGLAYTVPNTGLTLTFVKGAGALVPLRYFIAGDVHTFTCTPPRYTVTELAAGIAALLLLPVSFITLVATGEFADITTAVAIASALAGHAMSFAFQQRYVRTICDCGGSTPAATITGLLTLAPDTRVCMAYGDCNVITQKPFAGWGAPRRAVSQVIAARCGSISPSTDPARTASGALRGVISISYDEFRTELLDQRKVSTLRTWQGIPGFYITNARFMSPAGSDYEFWQHGRLMDIACDTVSKAQMPFLSSSVRLNGDGTINAADAERWEITVTAQLRAQLMDPDNAEGTPGHVSALSYQVDRTTNVLLSKTVKTKVAIRPLGYAKAIVTELGFSANV